MFDLLRVQLHEVSPKHSVAVNLRMVLRELSQALNVWSNAVPDPRPSENVSA